MPALRWTRTLRINNKKEFESVYSEVIMNFDKNKFLELFNFALDETYSYLFIDVRKQQFYKGIDLIIES